MIERLDKLWEQSKNLNYRDRGFARKGAKTRIFEIMSRYNSASLGSVRWQATWRKYTFHPVNSIFDAGCLREIADYCELKTKEHYQKKLDKTAVEVV